MLLSSNNISKEKTMSNRTDWVEKYRPTKVEECVLRNTIYSKIERMIQTGNMRNLLLKGPAGTGKTSFAKALSNDLNVYLSEWNSRTMDEMRKNLKEAEFHSWLTVGGKLRVALLDEFDHATTDVQKMLLKPMEGDKNGFTAWILIVNDASKLEETILSRVNELDFDIPEDEAEGMKKQFMRRCKGILDNERVNYTNNDLSDYINKFFPGFRKTLNELEGAVDVNNNLLPL